jgi:hypothetical protein
MASPRPDLTTLLARLAASGTDSGKPSSAGEGDRGQSNLANSTWCPAGSTTPISVDP